MKPRVYAPPGRELKLFCSRASRRDLEMFVALDAVLDHPVDGVAAAAADTDHLDPRAVVQGLVDRDPERGRRRWRAGVGRGVDRVRHGLHSSEVDWL